jgi:hypothetical protein
LNVRRQRRDLRALALRVPHGHAADEPGVRFERLERLVVEVLDVGADDHRVADEHLGLPSLSEP